MSNFFLDLIDQEIEKRAATRAAQMLAEYREKSEKPVVYEDVARDGTVIKPYLIGGVKYVTRKEAAALLDIQMPALWRWTKEGKIRSLKLGRKVYYEYEQVCSLIKKGGAS